MIVGMQGGIAVLTKITLIRHFITSLKSKTNIKKVEESHTTFPYGI
jgi:hypothetical protein